MADDCGTSSVSSRDGSKEGVTVGGAVVSSVFEVGSVMVRASSLKKGGGENDGLANKHLKIWHHHNTTLLTLRLPSQHYIINPLLAITSNW